MFSTFLAYIILDEGLTQFFRKVICAVTPLPKITNDIDSDIDALLEFIADYAGREETPYYLVNFIHNALVSCSGYRHEGNYCMVLNIIKMTLREIESYEHNYQD